MSTSPTVPMYAPDGTLGDVPYEQMHAALQAGGKIGVNITAPDGTRGVIPADRVQEAVKAGAKVIPTNLDQTTQKQGFLSTLGSDLAGMAKGVPSAVQGMFAPGAGARMAVPIVEHDEAIRQQGAGLPYRAGSALAMAAGTNVPGMEQSASQGDAGGVMGHAVAGAAPVIAYEAGKGVKAGAQAALDSLPSTAKAGQLFNTVADAAKGLPVDANKAGTIALQIKDVADAGGTMPKVVRNFLARVTDPDKGPLTYEEARTYASNASRVSTNEYNSYNKSTQRLLGQFARELNSSITDTASTVGQGENYTDAMSQFRSGAKIRDFQQAVRKNVVPAAIKGAAYTAGGGGLYSLYRLAKTP